MALQYRILVILLVAIVLFGAAAGIYASTQLRRKTAAARLVSRELNRMREEKERVAREIHDDVIQSVYAVGMGIEECRNLASDSQPPVREKLAHLKEAINHLIRDLRGFITGLETVSIQGREFKAALKSMLLTMGDEARKKVNFKVNEQTAALLTPFQATELLQIAREALTNALRHAKADRITVSLLDDNGHVQLAVEDNGVGFEPDSIRFESHGLHNMRSRAKQLSAQFQLSSERNRGTRITVSVKRNKHN